MCMPALFILLAYLFRYDTKYITSNKSGSIFLDRDSTSKNALWAIEKIESARVYYLRSVGQGRYLEADILSGVLRLRGVTPSEGFELIQAPNPGMIPAPKIVPVPASYVFPLRVLWKSVAHMAYLVTNGSKVEVSKEASGNPGAEWIAHYDKTEGISFQSASTGKFLYTGRLQEVSVKKESLSKATRFILEWHSDGVFILRCESGKYLGVDISLALQANRLPATSTEEFRFEVLRESSSSSSSSSSVAPDSPLAKTPIPIIGRKSNSSSGLPQCQSEGAAMMSHSYKGSGLQAASHSMLKGPHDAAEADGGEGKGEGEITMPTNKETLAEGVFVIKACYPGKAGYVTLMPNGEVCTSPRPGSSWILNPSITNFRGSAVCSCTAKNFQDDRTYLECSLPESCTLEGGPSGTRFFITSFEFPWSQQAGPVGSGAGGGDINYFTIQAVLDESSALKNNLFYLSYSPDDQRLNFVKSVDGTVSKMMLFEFIRIKSSTTLNYKTYPQLTDTYVPPKGLYPNF